MPTPSDLIEVVSQQFDLPTATVALLERNLVKARIRTAGPRGKNSLVTETDAANLMIGAAGTRAFNSRVKNCADVVETYGRLSAVDPATLKLSHWPTCMPTVPPGHFFTEGLAAVIANISAGRFDDPKNVWPQAGNEATADDIAIEVAIDSPLPHASISIALYSLSDDDPVPLYEKCNYIRLNNDSTASDFYVSCGFSEDTLRPIASIFKKPVPI